MEHRAGGLVGGAGRATVTQALLGAAQVRPVAGFLHVDVVLVPAAIHQAVRLQRLETQPARLGELAAVVVGYRQTVQVLRPNARVLQRDRVGRGRGDPLPYDARPAPKSDQWVGVGSEEPCQERIAGLRSRRAGRPRLRGLHLLPVSLEAVNDLIAVGDIDELLVHRAQHGRIVQGMPVSCLLQAGHRWGPSRSRSGPAMLARTVGVFRGDRRPGSCPSCDPGMAAPRQRATRRPTAGRRRRGPGRTRSPSPSGRPR
jgi:hypothetical protein